MKVHAGGADAELYNNFLFDILKTLLPEAKALKEDINRYESRLISIEQLYLS